MNTHLSVRTLNKSFWYLKRVLFNGKINIAVVDHTPWVRFNWVYSATQYKTHAKCCAKFQGVSIQYNKFNINLNFNDKNQHWIILSIFHSVLITKMGAFLLLGVKCIFLMLNILPATTSTTTIVVVSASSSVPSSFITTFETATSVLVKNWITCCFTGISGIVVTAEKERNN